MAKDLEYYLAQARRIAAHREAGAEKEIRKLYKEMLADLQSFVADAYVKYSQGDKLTFAMLQQAGYSARFLEEIEQRINVATPKAAKELRKLVEDTYKLAYEGMVDGVTKSAPDALDAAFAGSVAITPQQIKAAVENPVYGLTLKDTLEKNRKEIIYSIKQIVGVGLMNGDRYTTMARRIAEQVDGDYKKAIRIARTETHRVREAGNMAATLEVDKALENGTSGMRMVKTWKTMKDERVRPQRRRKGKGGWSTKMGKGANHMILDGQMVLSTMPFDLQDGNTAMQPGQSGIAGHDINCRCYASVEMMSDAEFFAKTGKHLPDSPEAKALKKEKALLDEQTNIKAERDAAEAEMQQLDAEQFANIWKNPVTAKDYEQLKDRLQAKRDYFKANGKQDMLDLCDQFEENGKKYMLAKDRFDIADKKLVALEGDIKTARQELMKLRGIDPAKMQKEIDDLALQINKLSTPIVKKVAMGTKVKNYDQKQLKEAIKAVSASYDDATIATMIADSADLTLNQFANDKFWFSWEKTYFKEQLKKQAVVTGDPAEITRLQALLQTKTDDLAKIMKRYGLEEDKFSKARKDKAYWFTGYDAKPRADKVLRPDTGAVWQAASVAERRAAYKYTSGSGSFNRPLRGYDGSWSNFKGVGKVPLDNEGSGADIKHLADIIDKNPSNFDIWLQRGVESSSGAASFLGVSDSLLNASESDLQQLLVGKVVKDEAFTSTAAAKGSGFSGRLILNIYAPKGTKMIYAEPFSAYGSGAKSSWDGISGQSSFGHEFEVILQKGTSFKITKIEKSGYTIYADVDVVGQ